MQGAGPRQVTPWWAAARGGPQGGLPPPSWEGNGQNGSHLPPAVPPRLPPATAASRAVPPRTGALLQLLSSC